MTNELRDDTQTSKISEQQPLATEGVRLGIGRGKPRPGPSNNDELVPPAPTTTWSNNNNATSGGFGSLSNKNINNDENSNSNNPRGFSSRTGGFSTRGGFGSTYDKSSIECYNCKKMGHTSRECPESQREYRGGSGGGVGRGNGFHSNGGSSTGGFHSGRSGFNSNGVGGDRNVNYTSSKPDGNSSISITVRNGGDQNDNNNHDFKSTTTNWSNGSGREANNTNSGFRSGRGGRGGTTGGGFNSSDHGYRGGSASMSGNCFNCNKPGHRSRDCPEPRKQHSSDQGYNNRESNHNIDQHGAQSNHPPTERYIPPPAPTTENDIFGQAVAKGENFGKYHVSHVQCTPPDKVKPIELYEEADLSTQILSNIRRAHFEEPTAIQRYTIPCIRQQDDLMACAQTGSGKTAAFLLPIISNLIQYHADELSERPNPPAPLCLIVSPTRELALQTESEARKFAYQTPVLPGSAVGGHDMFTVSDRLRQGCHVLSATTGRLKDMVEKGRISLKRVKYFVLDEADRMLDTGFEPDIRKLEDLGLPSKDERYTSMFSATFPNEVQKLAKYFLREDYVFLAVGTIGGANEDITQIIEEVRQNQKKERLFQLLEENLKSERCLIFVETKRSADYIGSLLSQKRFMSTTMHGDRTQKQRNQAVRDFANGACPILVATSVAARGLDFPLIGYVINYDLPDSSDFYIHRIGRTGRAGHLGKSISFFDPDRDSDKRIAPELILKLTEAGQQVPDFLKKYADDTNFGVYSNSQAPRSTDMRSRNNPVSHRKHAAAPSGGTTSAGGAEESWD